MAIVPVMANATSVSAAAFLKVLAFGGIEHARRLAPDVDWTGFDRSRHPVQAFLGASIWAEAETAQATVALQKLRDFLTELLHACVEHGRGDLVTEPYIDHQGSQHLKNLGHSEERLPIIECVRFRCAAGVMLCLEQGASALQVAGNGDPPDNACTLARDTKQPEIEDMIRAHLARQAALAATGQGCAPSR